jgi:serine/threonine protein kinase
VLVYPWHDGEVLHQATADGSDRSALARFQRLPAATVRSAIGVVLDAHLAVAAAGFVAVDLYDGCFLFDHASATLRLIDLDEYRPGPFVLEDDRLPGSRRYMAPEEWRRGARIDERTTVFTLGRVIHHLLDGTDGWRGTPAERAVSDRATATDPGERFASVDRLVLAWRDAVTGPSPTLGG